MSEKSDYFGLDIGTTGVRLVQLRGTGAIPALVSYGSVPLPEGVSQSDSPLDQDKVAEAIKQLVASTKVSTKNVVTGLPSAQAYISVITTPKLAEHELGKAMKLQADQYIPMAIDQVKMDWHIVGPGKTANEMQVLLVAAPNTVVNKYLRIVEKAGLELAALETTSIALIRALMPASDIAVLVVDIGSLNSEITIVHKRTPRLVRSVNVGGAVFMRAVAQNLGLEAAQAEQFTKKFGLTQTKLEGQVLRAIKPALDTLVTEIDKSVKFFGTQNEGVKIEKIILTGGTAALPELPTYLANAFSLPVEFGNPWTNVSYPASLQETLLAGSIQYAVAVGLAQRAFI